ncbi:MAG: hypothetical protein ABSB22_16420, partial [Thermodesulfobacteriota bacterium]
SSKSRKLDHKIWEKPPHTFKRQPGKKKDADDYQFKSCILAQKASLLTPGRKRWPTLQCPQGQTPAFKPL